MLCNRRLINVVWELTLKCNSHCIHCGSAAGIDRKDNLSDNEIMRICDELAEMKCHLVALIGGETFLHPLWKEIVKKLRSSEIEVQIITNALALNKEKIEFLSEQKIETVGISLDGSCPEIHDKIRNVPGIFNHIMSLKDDVFRNLLQTIAITTVTKKNFLDLPNILNVVSNSYFCTWQIQVGNPFGRLKEEMSLNEFEYYVLGIFITLMQRRQTNGFTISGMHCMGYYSDVIPPSVNVYNDNWHGCPAGKNVIGIRSNGKVVGCLSIYDDKYIEGDLKVTSLSDIWNNKDFCSWNTLYNKYKNLKGKCKDCEYGFSCGAGCCSSAISQTGDEGSMGYCYHHIEKKYKNYIGDDSISNVLQELTTGKITDTGEFVFGNGNKLNEESINKITNDDYVKQVLSILI